jgi:hypothetical protein
MAAGKRVPSRISGCWHLSDLAKDSLPNPCFYDSKCDSETFHFKGFFPQQKQQKIKESELYRSELEFGFPVTKGMTILKGREVKHLGNGYHSPFRDGEVES